MPSVIRLRTETSTSQTYDCTIHHRSSGCVIRNSGDGTTPTWGRRTNPTIYTNPAGSTASLCCQGSEHGRYLCRNQEAYRERGQESQGQEISPQLPGQRSRTRFNQST